MRPPETGLLAGLTRGKLVAMLIGLATAAGVVVLLGVFAPGWWSGSGGSYAPRTIVATSRITPRSALFGDLVTARLQVLVDPRRYDPASIQVAPAFQPYAIRSDARRVEPGVGRATLVEFTYSLQCLTEPCIQAMSQKSGKTIQTKAIDFPPARLTARSAAGAAVAEKVDWPALVVHSRLSAGEIALATPQLDPRTTLPAVSWRLSPNLLGALALVGAVLLALGACWLAASIALRDSRLLIRRLRIPAHLSSVERALLLAEHAAARGELDEERKALQRLAVELRQAGRRDLAGRAGRLAWSEETPSPEVLGDLVQAVRSNGAH